MMLLNKVIFKGYNINQDQIKLEKDCNPLLKIEIDF
jgi:hypothetical protein